MYKAPHKSFVKTKSKGDYSLYCEDTMASFNKTGIPKNLGFTNSQSELILRTLGYLIMEEVVKTNGGFSIPENIGSLRVAGCKEKAVNKNLSKLYQKKIFERNIGTGGYVFSARLRLKANFQFKHLRNFRASYGLKKAIKEQIKKGYMHFSMFQSFREMTHLNI